MTDTSDLSGIGASAYDRTLRVVMWLDAFVSLVAAGLALIGLPLVALLPVAPGVATAVGWGAILAALALAGFGVVTGVALMLRLNHGQYTLPANLRLPLPRAMRPEID